MRHRCAVCWDRQDDHEAWLSHVENEHGSTVAEFGYRECKKSSCPGVEHDHKLPNYGLPRMPRQRPEPRPFTARDGTTYTPVPLFPEGPAA